MKKPSQEDHGRRVIAELHAECFICRMAKESESHPTDRIVCNRERDFAVAYDAGFYEGMRQTAEDCR